MCTLLLLLIISYDISHSTFKGQLKQSTWNFELRTLQHSGHFAALFGICTTRSVNTKAACSFSLNAELKTIKSSRRNRRYAAKMSALQCSVPL
jgi:hypothetical protein